MTMDDAGLYFDKEGRPVGLEEWAQLIQDPIYKVLAQAGLGGFYVSTVWLGLNHEWDPARPPLIFETMVWEEDPTGLDRWHGDDLLQWRYTTEAEARAGHQRILDMITGGTFRDHLAAEGWTQ